MPRLRRSNCAAPGIARRRRGRGFEYRDPAGERIDDPEVLERIAELAIPPAWREVWICMDPRGHLQATGLDAAARKQYLYHEHWRVHRDRLKFDSMLAFGRALPRLRRRVARDLGHGRVAGRARLSPTWAELHAEDVNAYIKQHTGGAFTAKDFRTWNATVLAAVALAAAPQSERRPSRVARERAVAKAIKIVAAYLGNTPAVCRASYVDPRVIDRFHAGITIAETLAGLPAKPSDLADRGSGLADRGSDLADARVRKRIEAAVLDLLADASPAGRKAA